MRELLERWAALGEKVSINDSPVYTCPRVYMHSERERDGFAVVHGGFWHGYRVDPDCVSDRAHILAAVIEAVEARELQWNIWHVHTCVLYTAQVWPDNDKDLDLFEGDGATPAAALLSAYLDALDHQAAVDEYGGTR